MGLFCVSGTIDQLGHCRLDNEVVVYAYIVIVGSRGRTLVKNVAVATDVQSFLGIGLGGDFFFDALLCTGGHHQFWGVSAEGRVIVDGVDIRKRLGWHNMVWGVVLLPAFGFGLLPIALGVLRLWPIASGRCNRRKFLADRQSTGTAFAAKLPMLPDRLQPRSGMDF